MAPERDAAPGHSMRRLAPLLVLTLLFTPFSVSATSQSDPVGDETDGMGLGPAPCHDPRIDITEAEIGSDGTTLSLRMTVFDLEGALTCADGAASVPSGRLRWAFHLSSGSGGYEVRTYAENDTGALRFHYSIRAVSTGPSPPDPSTEVVGPAAGSRSGDTLTWTVPLFGTRPGTTEPYDLRGDAFRVLARTYEGIPSGVPNPFELSFLRDDLVMPSVDL